jgi:hypothetical protein
VQRAERARAGERLPDNTPVHQLHKS